MLRQVAPRASLHAIAPVRSLLFLVFRGIILFMCEIPAIGFSVSGALGFVVLRARLVALLLAADVVPHFTLGIMPLPVLASLALSMRCFSVLS